jgi:uncharacterized iron-regulated membrane protein
MPSRTSVRQIWISIHRWTGLTIGFLLALYCVAGSLVVFAPELEHMMMPELHVSTAAPAQMTGPDELYAKVRAAYPDKHKAWVLKAPKFAGSPYYAEYYSPEERGEAHDLSLEVPFDPVTGEMLEPWYWGEQLVSYIYRFHMSLYLDAAGDDVAGVLAIILMFSAVTGIYAWWPSKWNRRAFRIRTGSGWPTFMYDMHNAGGLYISLLLLLLSVTGLLIVWPGALSRGINVVTPVERLPSFTSHEHHSGAQRTAAVREYAQLRLNDSVAAALAAIPGSSLVTTHVPARGETVVRIVVQPRDRMTTAEMWFDGTSATLLHVSNPDVRGAGQNIVKSAYPLHNGTAFGLPGRIAIIVIGVSPLALYITGFWLWLRKGGLRRLTSRSKKRVVERAVAAP